MNIQLTQKERMLLEDQKSHEQICIQKYNNYANMVQDPQLKQMFYDFASQEQSHLDTINQILNGQIPNINQQQQGQQMGQQNMQNQQNQQSGPNMQSRMSQMGQGMQQNTKPQEFLQDLLMTEKYVSGSYNITIFEFANPQIRDVLNHIQKEEQKHGEGIFNYMNSHGMYNPK